MKNNIYKILFLFALALGLNSCETKELEILESPNALTPDQADIDFFLNAIQISGSTFFEGITEEGMEVTRILHQFGPTYDNGYGPGQLNAPYTTAYAGIVADNRAMEPLATELGLYTHIAIGQIMEAYAITTLVDYLGDVPYSEAGLGLENENPNLDDGQAVYEAMQTLLDSAIANLNLTASAEPSIDLYYNGDKDNWIRFANTLKLKLYLQTRLVSAAASTVGINNILASGDYIQSADQDFVFRYSSVDANPDSRHPIFARNFDNGVTDYQSNSYMDLLLNDKSLTDPRIRYYFYRNRANRTTDANALQCITETAPTHYPAGEVFCTADQGYNGRDHHDNAGIPPDENDRCDWGVYPIGARFDDNSFDGTNDRTVGAQGAGISPIMLSSYVDFMLAESALELGTTGDARTYLANGMTKSFDKVINFRADLTDASVAPTAADVTDYIDEVLANYDAAADNDARLEIIVTEYFIALFGNGVEAYNTYRRTGKPENLQPSLLANPGVFIRSFLYPSNLVDRNSNVEQKPNQAIPVFWDTNPEGFVD
ncbi:Starch-binding associating with outer membrane [Aquimarina amphilecti]|uniref:Starch-binding associating with outer membrane n=1 Tax=Aquimarina amphilecti TaxID=1038014 RepID=A0A1H7UPE8_AQUAM|nr:SusD/RagB family nutrient-binding outer membrane lipoprotein [Aquimarina amphilecti]SEL98508.1 Starch-binding associating with outer membrane [Aquimarina amphilecti]